MNDVIVTLEVIAVFQNGQEVGLTARIGRAQEEDKQQEDKQQEDKQQEDKQQDHKQQEDKSNWVCPVELSPVYQEPMRVKGVDSFHATWLACSLVLKLLGHLKAEGVALRAADGSAFPLEGYLAGLGAEPRDAEGG